MLGSVGLGPTDFESQLKKADGLQSGASWLGRMVHERTKRHPQPLENEVPLIQPEAPSADPKTLRRTNLLSKSGVPSKIAGQFPDQLHGAVNEIIEWLKTLWALKTYVRKLGACAVENRLISRRSGTTSASLNISTHFT